MGLRPFQASILAHRPGHQRRVEVAPQRIQRRGTKPTVVLHPSRQEGIVPPADVPPTEVRAVTEIPPPGRLPPGVESRGTDRGGKAHQEAGAWAMLHPARAKGVPENVHWHRRIPSLTARVLAVDQPGLLGVQFPATVCPPRCERASQGLRLPLRLALNQPLIGVAAPGNAGILTPPPSVEGLVQE
jgi:hypothetical protein